MKPFFSIVTVVYNGAGTLRRAIESVLRQEYTDFEYIIIDGGSTDGSVNIIQEYDNRIDYWVSENDLGIYNAWNKALAQVNGLYVSFLGADDEYLPNALLAYRATLDGMSECDYVSSKVKFGTSPGRVIGQRLHWPKFGRVMTVAHVGSFHNTRLYDRYGFYNEQYAIVGDYEFLLRCGANIKVGYLNAVTVLMGDQGVSNKNILEALRETLRAKRETGSAPQLLCYCDFILAILKAAANAMLRPVKNR